MAGSTWTLTGNSSGAQGALKGAGSAFSMLGNVVTGVNQALELGAKVLGVAKKGWEAFDKYAVQVSKDVAVAADNLAKFSRTVGESTADMQAWRSAAGMAGIDAGKFDKSVLKANKALLDADRGLATNVELFDKLGISARNTDGEIKTGTELLGDMATAFKDGVVPEGQQAAITMQLLGDRTGMMAGFLRQGTEVVDQAASRLENYGAIMSDKLLDVSEQYIDSTQRRTEAESGWKNAIAEGTLPTMTALNNVIAATIGSQGGLRDAIKKLAERWLPAAAHALVDTAGYVSRLGLVFKIMFHEVYGGLSEIRERLYGTIAGIAEGVSEIYKALGMDEAAKIFDVIAQKTRLIEGALDKMGEAQEAAIARTVRQKEAVTAWEDAAHRAIDSQLKLTGSVGQEGEGSGGEAPPGVGDEAEIQAEKVTGAVDSMTEDYSRLGESIGSNIASIITAEDKTEAAKDAVKQMAIEGIKYLGQMAMTAVAGRASIATTNVASSVAETAAATPAAIVGAIASEGANVGLASAAVAGGVALMSGIIAGIGDRGIPAGLLGPGRHTVIMRGDEAITDPAETASQVRVGQRLEQAMGNGGGGGGADLLASAFGGGGGQRVTVPVVMQFPWGEFMDYFDVDVTERTEMGLGPFANASLGVSG